MYGFENALSTHELFFYHVVSFFGFSVTQKHLIVCCILEYNNKCRICIYYCCFVEIWNLNNLRNRNRESNFDTILL